MYSEDQLLPISALQHLIFCERQCALIHVERLWEENRLTVEGRQLHDRAHDGADEYRKDVTIARGMPVRSLRLGLFGVADVVELHRSSDGTPMRVIPIEYKRGKPKKDDSDRVQVAAQAVCLEEMLSCSVNVAYLYYGTRKRRTEVAIDATLRARLEQATERLHQMIADRETPRAVREPKCERCSLLNVCLPGATQPSRSAQRHYRRRLAAVMTADGPQSDLEFDQS